MIKHLLVSILLTMIATVAALGQEVVTYDTFAKFSPILNQQDDKIHVVNFWATWCKPCVKELPYFEELHRSGKYKVTLVSLDFAKDIEKRVIPFLKEKEYTAKVVLLDDPKSNTWIDLVDRSWSGAIPATVIYQGDKRLFFEQEFHSTKELTDIINKHF